MSEFVKGDRVKYSSLAHEKFGVKRTTGVVVFTTHEKYPNVRVLVDGLKCPISYSKDFWVKDEMSDEIIKLNINYASDREAVVVALANAGYPVYVEEEKDFHNSSFFVCFRFSKEKAK